MQLSPHFSLRELTRSQTARRKGLANDPGAVEIENLIRLAHGVLEPVRAQFGVPFSPTSGYRCPPLNRAIGGAARSQHINGEAVDFRIPGLSNMTVACWIQQTLTFDQLILEYPMPGDADAGWVHCSLVSTGNRGDVLTLTRAGYGIGLYIN